MRIECGGGPNFYYTITVDPITQKKNDGIAPGFSYILHVNEHIEILEK